MDFSKNENSASQEIELENDHLSAEFERADSDASWSASQGLSQGKNNSYKERLFLVHLGAIMSLFRCVKYRYFSGNI